LPNIAAATSVWRPIALGIIEGHKPIRTIASVSFQICEALDLRTAANDKTE